MSGWSADEVLVVCNGRVSPSGQVCVPAAWLRRVGASRTLIMGQDTRKALAIRTPESFERFIVSMLDSEVPEGGSRRLRRLYTAGACELRVDARGRVCIPGVLRDYVELGLDIVWLEFEDCIRVSDAVDWRRMNEPPIVRRNSACYAENDRGRSRRLRCGTEL
jgi:DNA-binding transcriptional regulator/RsmH inhibitor MraZ